MGNVSFINDIKQDNQWRIQDFPRGGRQPPGGAPGYNFIKFSRKLHEIEKNLAARGGRPPLDPPLGFPRVWGWLGVNLINGQFPNL